MKRTTKLAVVIAIVTIFLVQSWGIIATTPVTIPAGSQATPQIQRPLSGGGNAPPGVALSTMIWDTALNEWVEYGGFNYSAPGGTSVGPSSCPFLNWTYT